jgi:hypothetical protein
VAEASLSSTKKTGGCKRCKKTVPVAKKVL